MPAALSSLALYEALASGRVSAAVQPLVSLRCGEVARFEALARLTTASGAVPATSFVSLAERTGLITKLTFAVLGHVAPRLESWRQIVPDVRVDLNLSMRSLLDRKFPGQLAAMLAAHGCEARWFGFEITESTFMRDPKQATRAVAALRAMGCSVSIDDFGSGYSSMSLMADLPVQAIKMDRQFVTAMVSDHRREAIVRATIALGHDLGFEVVAEGVEDRETWALLRALGCDLAQGHHIARPMATEAVPEWIDAWAAGIRFVRKVDESGELLQPIDREIPGDTRRAVLIVDDEPAIVSMVKGVLIEHGFRVATAANGAEALTSIEGQLPAVVLLDMNMSLADGAVFIEALQRRGAQLPIVVMAAGPSAERWARELGADAYLRKPLDLPTVIATVSRFAVASAGDRPH